jgi:hypothetical protein
MIPKALVSAAIAALVGVVACGGAGDSAQSAESLANNNVHVRSTISFAPNSFVIGNAYPGWTDYLHGATVFQHGPGNDGGANYQCGYLLGPAFDHCGWINRNTVGGSPSAGACGSDCPGTYDTSLFVETYTNGEVSSGVSDGDPKYMNYGASGCSNHLGYGNVDPWKVPASPHDALSSGPVPNGKVLHWRYTTKGGHWALVHDHPAPAGDTNWYFVERACLTNQAPAAPPAPPPPTTCGVLEPGQGLTTNETLTSCGGQFRFIVQPDGNVVEYQGGTPLWAAPNTFGHGGDRIVMQGDGNLVVYVGSTALWASHTNGHPGAYFAVQDDGNIVVYQGSTPLWARFGL